MPKIDKKGDNLKGTGIRLNDTDNSTGQVAIIGSKQHTGDKWERSKMLVIEEEEKGKIPAQRRKENPGIEGSSWRSPSQFINKNCRRRMRAKRVTKVLDATRYGDGDGDGSGWTTGAGESRSADVAPLIAGKEGREQRV